MIEMTKKFLVLNERFYFKFDETFIKFQKIFQQKEKNKPFGKAFTEKRIQEKNLSAKKKNKIFQFFLVF
jgi:hypothetical protein